MSNPSPRRQIRPRQGMDALTAPLNATGGRGIGIASNTTRALGDTGGQHPVIGFTAGKDFNKWAALAPALAGIAQVAADVVMKRYEEKTAEEKRRENELRAQQEVIDTIHGAATGQRLLYDVEEKTRSGEMSGKDAEEYIRSQIEDNRDSLAYTKALGKYALKANEIADGYARLDKLRDHIYDTVLKETKLEEAEASRVFQETTKDAYIDAITELSQLADADAVKAWEAENIAGKSVDELKAIYGDHRADIVNAVSRKKDNPKPEGNDQALAEWSMAIQRGTAEWDDVKADTRMSDKQKVQLFATMRDMTQKANLGYISDAQLASKLLLDLEGAWKESIYTTPWGGSKQIDPSRPPVITPEGLYYQGELFKRLKDLDPQLDVVESNRQKQEIAQEVKNDIISGKLRFERQAANLDESAPELKLSVKVEEGKPLTDRETTLLAKCYNDGGAKRIHEVYGFHMFKMKMPEQVRIASEAQRMKAEIDAIKSAGVMHDVKEYMSGMAAPFSVPT